MITISQIIEQIISDSPFLEEYINRDLINISQLARELRPDIEKQLGKVVKDSAVIMALNRMPKSVSQLHTLKLRTILQQISDISVRSSLTDYTFKNSGSFRVCLTEFMVKIKNNSEVFFTISQGIYESTIIINKSIEPEISEMFKNEICVNKEENITAVNIRLPEINTKTKGVYYMIFKQFTDSNINIKDVVSTSNELTILIDSKDSEKAFSTINKLRKV